MAGDERISLEIDVQDAVPIVEIDIQDVGVLALVRQVGAVGMHPVQPAEGLRGQGHQFLDLSLLAEIEMRGDRLAAGVGDFPRQVARRRRC